MDEYRRSINRSIILYIIGACCFIALAIGLLWFSYYFFKYYNEHDYPAYIVLLSISGLIMLWDIIKSFRLQKRHPQLLQTFIPTGIPRII